MLAELYVQNIAVIQKASIRFTDKLNIFTGETGAGKSVLIHAINGLLGERISKDSIRTGESKATITALFTDLSEPISRMLDEMGYPCEEGELLVSREVTVDGKSRCTVNGIPATLTVVRTIVPQLVTIHGQNDNQKLFRPENHIGYIDRFGDLAEDIAAYENSYREMLSLQQQIDLLITDDSQKQNRIDLLTYQVGEIDAAELRIGEEEELLAERNKIRNAEKITKALSKAHICLSGSEEQDGMLSLFDLYLDAVSDCARYLDDFAPMLEKGNDIAYELQGYADRIRDALDEMEFDPHRLDELEDRLDLLYRLKKKYGSDIREILEYAQHAKQELDAMQFSEEKLRQLKSAYQKTREEAESSAAVLSRKRRQTADRFSAMVQEELAFLNMPSIRLEVQMQQTELSRIGADRVEFFISVNKGESLRPLAKVASGGEISRIMLAVQTVLSDKDDIATVIFDEIDTGVSGSTASKIGNKLRQVSDDRQVLCVTHLAQVAAFADRHLLIRKSTDDTRTFTDVLCLTEEERVGEIARILGGETVTQATLQAAEELIRLSGRPA